MKLYRFRPLANELDLCRATCILETGKFRCSFFWELNDPMEGVYYTPEGKEFIDAIYKAKLKKICSFSACKGFINPIMWGYYANGFRGLAIKIDVDGDAVDKIEEMEYLKELPVIKNSTYSDEITKTILTTKLKLWEHEAEYRFITNVNDEFHKIGKITSVYFGDPYDNAVNSKVVSEYKIVNEYNERKTKLIDVAKGLNLKVFKVYIKDNKIISVPI